MVFLSLPSMTTPRARAKEAILSDKWGWLFTSAVHLLRPLRWKEALPCWESFSEASLRVPSKKPSKIRNIALPSKVVFWCPLKLVGTMLLQLWLVIWLGVRGDWQQRLTRERNARPDTIGSYVRVRWIAALQVKRERKGKGLPRSPTACAQEKHTIKPACSTAFACVCRTCPSAYLDASGLLHLYVCMYVCMHIHIWCEVMIWSKFGPFGGDYLVQVGVIIWSKFAFLAYFYRGFKRFLKHSVIICVCVCFFCSKLSVNFLKIAFVFFQRRGAIFYFSNFFVVSSIFKCSLLCVC